MAAIEITDRSRIAGILEEHLVTNLEAYDECLLGVDGLVTVFAEDVERPASFVTVRWGQKSLGLGSVAQLTATRVLDLPPLLSAFPAERGLFDLAFPFWASSGVASGLVAEPVGALAYYQVDRARLAPSPAVRQCTRLDDLRVVKPMFPKLAEDTPVYVLALRGELVAVAAVTHLQKDVARCHAYTVEGSRGRGFGRAVLTALAEELLALKLRPTAAVELGDEAAVRLIENAGFFQAQSWLKGKVTGRRVEAAPPGPGLIGLTRR